MSWLSNVLGIHDKKVAANKEHEQQQNAWSNLDSLLGTANKNTSDLNARAMSQQDLASHFFNQLISGDRNVTQQTAAPAINAVRSGADAAKRERAAMGTGRTGGGVANEQQAATNTRSQVDTLLGGFAPAAAQELGNLGGVSLQAMLGSMGLGEGAATSLAGLIGQDLNQKSQNSTALWSSLITGGAKLGAAFI